MAYSYPEIRKFLGLFLQANSFEVPDGALEAAENVIIQNDNQILKFPGFHTYFEPGADEFLATTFGDNRGTSDFYGVYYLLGGQGVLRRLDISSFGVNIGTLGDVVPGETFFVDLDPREVPPKTAVANDIRYFTAQNGTFRLELIDTDFFPRITKSGVPPGLDLSLIYRDPQSSGPLPAGSQTSYRVVFGRKDYNGKVLLGAPSDILTVVLPEGETDIAYTATGVGPYTVEVNKVGHGLQTADYIEVTAGSDADVIGSWMVTRISDDIFTFSIPNSPGGSGTLTYTYSRAVGIQTSIPGELDDADFNWFIQIYRTTSSESTNAVPVTPTPDFALIHEAILTQADLDLGVYYFFDEVDPILAGAELYTNPNSQEGELQANIRPPVARDICTYKNYMIYAGIKQRARLSCQMVDTVGLDGELLGLDGLPSEHYQGTTGAGNRVLRATSVAGVGTVTITYATHAFLDGTTVLITQVTGTVPPGSYVISNVTINTFDITPGGALTASDLYFEGILDPFSDSLYYVDTVSSSIGLQIQNTAQALVRAINRRPNGKHYANYRSGPEDAPGKISIEWREFYDTASDQLFFFSESDLNPNPFVPPITQNNGTTIRAASIFEPNNLYVSKYGEPDAVPLLQFFPVGNRSSEFLQCLALQDAVILIKEDGIFRLTGDTLNDFTIATVDPTNFGFSCRGAAKIANSVIALTNQGIVEISANGAAVLSRRIDELFQQIVGGFSLVVDPIEDTITTTNLKYAVAEGYETGRLWLLSIPEDTGMIPAQTYIYNIVNQTYTTTDYVFKSLSMGPQDRLYGAGTDDTVKVLRKYTQRLDYCREYAIVYAFSDASDSSIVYFQMGAGPYLTPKQGDIIVYQNVISRIASIVYQDGNWRAQMMAASNIPSSSSTAYLYEAYASTVKFAPFHAGQVGRMKQFAQMMISTRQFSVSRMSIDFQTNYFLASDELDWYVNNILEDDYAGSGPTVLTYGWGTGPWGEFGWGAPTDPDNVTLVNQSVFLDIGTRPSVQLRTYVPLFAQRSAFIQPILVHAEAGEPMLIQGVSWAVRGYGEKTTR